MTAFNKFDKVIYCDEICEIEEVLDDDVYTIYNPFWTYEDEELALMCEEEYDVPFFINVKGSELEHA